MRNQVQLITYADRLGGSLPGLAALLRGPLAGLFGGVHVLPFFTPIDGADAGFDPVDHTAVDPRLGTWDDVASLARDLDVMADLIVNHVSAESPQFRDFLARGDASEYAGMFLTLGKVFPDGAREDDLVRIYRPRPGLPFTSVTLGDRTRRIVWTTFTPQQVDVDVTDPGTRRYLEGILDRLAASGVGIVRLDAVGYAVKTPGTSCFMTPETLAFISELSAVAGERGIEVLVEIHAHYDRILDIAERVDWTYDFALPALVLYALFAGDGAALRRWLEIRPRNAVTVLDTHDGIGVRDVGPDQTDPRLAGLLPDDAIDQLVEGIHERSDGASRLATGAAASNVDLYQVNCTYYDALGRDDHRYLLARLIQFFSPGVPQVYYVGLLAGGNDLDLLQRTGVGRDINRHHYTPEEIEATLERDVVRRLVALIRFRNTHPAFAGRWALVPRDDEVLAMRWEHGTDAVELHADLAQATYEVRLEDRDGARVITDLETLPGGDVTAGSPTSERGSAEP